MGLNKNFDAIVVGSGPNGLAAAVVLQSHGVSTLLVEGKSTLGGGTRTMELTLPGYSHDVCSAIHPLVASGPFFPKLPLDKFGLEFLHPQILAAHPLNDGKAVALYRSIQQTASRLGADENTYTDLMRGLTNDWESLSQDFMGPLSWPRRPFALANFGLKALQPSTFFAKKFKETASKALWAGMAAHGIQPLSNMATSAIALVLMCAGHYGGWPVIKGGSQSLANALANYFISLGGEIKTGHMVKNLSELPSSKALLFDLSPKQLMEIAEDKFSSLYRWQLKRFKYGMGVFKVDYALDGPVPWLAQEARLAGTVHLGGTLEEISLAEASIWKGKYSENPYVLVAQQSIVDPSRAPEGKHTLWAYTHVPSGSTRDVSNLIENQIEKSAPGFKKLILAKKSMNCMDLQEYNPNYIGGDINAGVQDITQIFTRPALRKSPYRTSAKGIYLCSSSTPPGGGVHGMCGYHAAQRAIKDLF